MIRTSSERIRRLSTEVIVYDEIGKAIGESLDLQKLSEVILKQLVPATLADWGLLLVCAEFSDRLEMGASLNLKLTPAQREAISSAQGFLGPIRQKPADLVINNFVEEERFKSSARIGFRNGLPSHRHHGGCGTFSRYYRPGR
jgi:hypothetical protein